MNTPATKRILVVDDETDLTQYLTILLARRTGHEVKSASTAKRALDMLAESEFHLVVSDIHMPGMSGLELLRETKSKYPDTEVVLLTGQGSLDTAVDALKLQAYDYIEKPVNAERLVQAVRNALAQQALASELTRTVQQIAELNRDLKRQVREHVGVQLPRERLATARVVLDHLERTLGPELAQTGAFLKLRAALDRRRPAREPADIGALVRTQALELAAVYPWVELRLEVPPEPLVAEVEPGAVLQAVRVILENAIQAMAERGTVHVGARAGEGEILIRVRDAGPGFTRESLDALDEPLAAQGAGTGLGLPIARRIAADHGGALDLANPPDGGAQVTLRIPSRH